MRFLHSRVDFSIPFFMPMTNLQIRYHSSRLNTASQMQFGCVYRGVARIFP